jgi:hypothetical protein
MRSLALAFVLSLALLVGCLNNAPPDSVPPGVTAQQPSPSPSPTPSPPSDGAHPGGAMLVRPAHNESSGDGFTLLGDESASGFIGGEGSVAFTFQARDDSATNASAQGGCVQDPVLRIEDANGTQLALEPPMAHCMGILLVPMQPGDSEWANLTWNGTAYHDETAYTVAPGMYWAIATFKAQRDGADVTLETRVPVNVLDASARGAL